MNTRPPAAQWRGSAMPRNGKVPVCFLRGEFSIRRSIDFMRVCSSICR